MQIILGASLGPSCRPDMDTFNALLQVHALLAGPHISRHLFLPCQCQRDCCGREAPVRHRRHSGSAAPPWFALLLLLLCSCAADRPSWPPPSRERHPQARVQGVVHHRRKGTGLSDATSFGRLPESIQGEALALGCRPNKLTHALYCELHMLHRREQVGRPAAGAALLLCMCV